MSALDRISSGRCSPDAAAGCLRYRLLYRTNELRGQLRLAWQCKADRGKSCASRKPLTSSRLVANCEAPAVRLKSKVYGLTSNLTCGATIWRVHVLPYPGMLPSRSPVASPECSRSTIAASGANMLWRSPSTHRLVRRYVTLSHGACTSSTPADVAANTSSCA